MGAQCTSPQSAPWYAYFFLDPGVKWCRMRTGNPTFVHAVPWIGILMLLVRSFVESWVLGPIGLRLNVSDKTCSHPETNDTLSKAYEKCKYPGDETLGVLAREVGWTPYKVHKWFWRARQYSRPSQLTKFKESSWRFVIYSCTSVLGLWYLHKENFFWDRMKAYQDFPMNTPSDTVMVYWACQLAFYISLLVSHHSDIRRSDYMLMLLHHIFTVLLLGMSYLVNGVQIGTLILLAHDISDVPLELAKLFKYIRYDRCAQVTFGIFSFLFFVTRMVLYPFFLLWSVLFEYPVVISHSPAWWLMVLMLVTLQGMHLYWFYLIYQMAKALLLQSTAVDKDIRSEPEFTPHTFEENNSVTDDSQVTEEMSQQSVVSMPPGSDYPIPGADYTTLDPGSTSQQIVHRKNMY